MKRPDYQAPISHTRMPSYMRRPIAAVRARGTAGQSFVQQQQLVAKASSMAHTQISKLRRGGKWETLALTVIVVVALLVSMLSPLFSAWHIKANYDLSSAKSLLSSTPKYLQDKLKYDRHSNGWLFNEPAESLLTKSKDSVSIGDVTYTAKLPGDILSSNGLTLTDTQSQLDIKLKPQFAVSTGQEQDGHVVYPLVGSKSQLVYSFKNNGVKEDIILYRSPGDTAAFSYSMQLPTGMEARIQHDGSVGIFGGDPTLFSNISYGSDKDKALVEKARQNSAKTHLYYEIPAPVVTGSKVGGVKARFTIDGSKLTVRVEGLANAQYPLSIDPSFVMNTSGCTWQSGGNNEDNISYSGCQIARQSISGGTLGSWAYNSAGNDYSAATTGQTIVNNGYAYLNHNNGTISYASINASTGVVGSFTATTGFSNRTSTTLAAYNGYIYAVGGLGGTFLTSTIMAKPASNGAISSWTTLSSTLTTGRNSAGVAVYGGRIYAVGGCVATSGGTCSTVTNTSEYATIRADGSLSSWTTTTSIATAEIVNITAYNGYLYAVGGSNPAGTTLYNTTYYAAIKSDGSLGSWQTGSTLPVTNGTGYSIAYNGYLYYLGGSTAANTYTNVTYLAKIYANGAIGPYQTTSSMQTNHAQGGAFAYNGRLYYAFGCISGTGCTTQSQRIEMASISTTLGNTSSYTGTSTYNSAGIMNYASVVANGYIYLIGGTTGTAGGDATQLNTARYAALNTDGSLGTWNTTSSNFTNLTAAGAGGVGCTPTECKGRLNAAAGTYNGYIYLAGGVSNGTGYWWGDIQSAVQCTGVNAPVTGCAGAGDLRGASGAATWTTQLDDFITNSTTTYNNANGRSQMSMQIYNGYMYLVGGHQGGTGGADYANIYYAPLTTSGGVGTFAATTSLPSVRSNSKTFVSGNRFYVVGGGVGSGWAFTSNDNDDVLFTTINSSTGALSSTCPSGYTCLSGTSWVDANAAANGGSGSSFITSGTLDDYAVVVTNGYVYVSGGNNGSAGATNTFATVYKAKMNSDGSMGSWSTISSMGNNRYSHSSFAANGFIYTIGGCTAKSLVLGTNCNSAAQMLSDYQSAVVYNGGGGRVGTSSTTTALPTAVAGASTIIANGYIYNMGGATAPLTPTAIANVYYAPINGDGTIGSWTAGPSLNTARHESAAVTTGGYIYLLGGRGDGAAGALNTGEYAKINTDGSLSGWTQFTMADARTAAAAFVNNGYLYIAGGTTDLGTALSTVKYSQIGANGVPGSWSGTTAGLTQARMRLQGFSVNGKVYIMGGISGSTYYDSVEYATPTGAGDITSWSAGRSFPFARARFASVVANGYVYIYSGRDSVGGRSDIYFAPIMADGSLGHWEYGGAISGTVEFFAGYASNGGYLYLLGGSSNGLNVNTTVSYAPLQGTPNVAHYSLLLTTDMRTLPASFLSALAAQGDNSSVHIQLSLATTTTGFTSAGSTTEVKGSTSYPLTITSSDGGSAYLVLFTLDDTASTVFGESTTAGTSLSYFKLNYHPNPAMRLRGGKTFNSSQLQSLDAP